MSRFSLSKWYLDCVSDDGRVFIGYAASLRWGHLHINYSSALSHYQGATKTNTSLTNFSAPSESSGTVHWRPGSLGVEGTWVSSAVRIDRTMLASGAGRVDWECLIPNAQVEVQAGDRQTKGLGYVEHLTMSLPPWHLPIDELRWGRYLSNDDALVWIDWRGPTNVKLVFLNDVQLEGARVMEDGIATEDGDVSLYLEDTGVIREGPLIRTALSSIPGIQNLIPTRSLYANESKWLSRATLKRRGEAVSTGWAIHEVVRWPKTVSSA